MSVFPSIPSSLAVLLGVSAVSRHRHSQYHGFD